jgi:hypothetical protein
MQKKKNPIKTARTTIASVKREMQKPRLTESVRNHGIDQDVRWSKNNLLVPAEGEL